MNLNCRTYWQTYLEQQSLPFDTQPFEIFYFSDDVEFADYLANSTISGFKTGTASLYWDIELGNAELPATGDLSLVTFANGNPACIIQTVTTEIVPFNKVSKEFAASEDAMNPSLKEWRTAHWKEFSEQSASLGKIAHESMPIVCERFKVVQR